MLEGCCKQRRSEQQRSSLKLHLHPQHCATLTLADHTLLSARVMGAKVHQVAGEAQTCANTAANIPAPCGCQNMHQGQQKLAFLHSADI